MILKTKKNRHRILYKKFVLLRKNVQNRKKLNLLKFNKKKWKSLIIYLKRLQLRRKKNFPMYDINRYFHSKFSNSFKRKYNYILQTKKKFKLFYGGLSQKYIKNQVKKILTKNSNNFSSHFLNKIESRLDVILYRSHFALSIRSSRQLILHKHVKVNDIIIKNYSYILNKGDLIKISFSGIKLVEFNVQNSHIWPLPPKYLNINYKTLQIVFNNTKRNYQNFSILFPFWLDFFNVIKSYQ